MTDFVLKISALRGWRRVLLALCIGALAAAALPPLSLWPSLFISLPTLIWMLDGVHTQSGSRKSRLISAFAVGWAFGAGYFAVSLYWIGEAFLVEAELFAWLLPLAVTAMPAGLALFWAAGLSLAMVFWAPGFGRVLVLSASLAGFEWLRGHVFTGFPWNAIAYATDALLPVAQMASAVGMYGVCFLVLMWAAMPAVLADEASKTGTLASRGGVLAALLSAIAVFVYGKWRLDHTAISIQPSIQMRIVQPNIAQNEKWQPENRQWIYQRYLELTGAKTGGEPITHVVWPESALPALIDEQPDVRQQIAKAAGARAQTILGSLRRQSVSDAAPEDSDLFNSVLVIDSDGRISARYDKQKLVPFGEYLPLARFLEPLGLRKLVVLPSGFTSGPGPLTVNVAGTPAFAPLICYEAIFPRTLISRNAARPNWLLNVTNDAWFGNSAGPYQHLAQARMRAIEEGLPLVRAANTGISAMIDPLGRIRRMLTLGRAGVIDAKLPMPLRPTLYSEYGDTFFFGVLMLIILGRIRTIFANIH